MEEGVRCSVVIPTYNAASSIDGTVRSVFEQTTEGIELICVDDASSDGTLGLLESLKEGSDIPFKVFINEGKGASAARNQGLQNASGEWVQFLDADDLLLPEKIEHQMKLGGKKDVVVGDYLLRDGKGGEKRMDSSLDRPWYRLMSSDLGVTSSILWQKEILERVGGWDQGLESSQEYDLLFRVMDQGADLVHDESPFTIKVDKGKTSISGRDPEGKWYRFLLLRSRILERVRKKRKVPAEEKRYCYQAYFDALRMAYPYLDRSSFSHFKEKLPAGFTPFVSSTTSRGYLWLFKILGLEKAEELRKWFRRKKSRAF